MNKRNRRQAPLSLQALQFAFSKFGPIFPRYFGNAAYRLWFTTHRFSRSVAENKAAASAIRTSIRINNIDVAVWCWGEGKPVLFIHGWSGRGTQAAPFLQPLISSGYRVISYDGPAHGDTPGKTTDMLEIADVVIALGETYGPFHSTITHSFGGMILAYAGTLGFHTSSAVCICPPATIYTILDNFQRSLKIPDGVLAVMKNKLFTSYGNDLDKRVSTLKNLNSLPIPALIVHDKDDTDIPWQDGEAVAKAWPDSQLVLTQGLGHRRILRNPATIAAVTEFIKKNH